MCRTVSTRSVGRNPPTRARDVPLQIASQHSRRNRAVLPSPSRGPRSRSRHTIARFAQSAGLAAAPGADAGRASPLLVAGAFVAAHGALGEACRRLGAVLGGVVVVVRELRDHAGDLQAQSADAREHSPVRRGSDGDHGVVVPQRQPARRPDVRRRAMTAGSLRAGGRRHDRPALLGQLRRCALARCPARPRMDAGSRQRTAAGGDGASRAGATIWVRHTWPERPTESAVPDWSG